MASVPLTGVNNGSYVGTLLAPGTNGPILSAEVRAYLQAVLDDAAWHEADKLSKSAGGTVAGAVALNSSGNTLGASSVITAAAGAKIDGTLQFKSTSTVELFGWTRVQLPEAISTADQTLVIGTNKQHVMMATAPGSAKTIALPQGPAWATITGYSAVTPDYVTHAGNVYVCSQTGTSGATGPTGTGTGITDGSAKWDFVSPAPIAGDWFRITAVLDTSTFPIQVDRITNLGSSHIALLSTSEISPVSAVGMVEVYFDGSDWKGFGAGNCCLHGGDW